MKTEKILLIILIILSVIVLAGQVWPAGAPPFARLINIFYLLIAFGYFIFRMRHVV